MIPNNVIKSFTAIFNKYFSPFLLYKVHISNYSGHISFQKDSQSLKHTIATLIRFCNFPLTSRINPNPPSREESGWYMWDCDVCFIHMSRIKFRGNSDISTFKSSPNNHAFSYSDKRNSLLEVDKWDISLALNSIQCKVKFLNKVGKSIRSSFNLYPILNRFL